jgi:peptidyl-prolyl cis-trans isomerase B (cyclophilin B)
MSIRKLLKLCCKSTVAVVIVMAASTSLAQRLTAVIDTSKGEIRVELNARAAPTTVANFVNLAQRGFYNTLSFHRVERNFMVQGGDPEGDGSGDPGYKFRGEIVLKHNQPGIISMANSGPGSDGSQFFITHLATPRLDGLHSVFGKVIAGLSVVYKIRPGDLINSITIEGDASSVFNRRRAQLDEWNQILDQQFPDLEPSQVKVAN